MYVYAYVCICMCLCILMCAVCIVHVQDTYTNVYVQDTYTNVYRTHMHMHAYMHAYIHTLVGSGPLFPQSVLQCLCSCATFRGLRALEFLVVGHRGLQEGMPWLPFYRPRDAWDGLRELTLVHDLASEMWLHPVLNRHLCVCVCVCVC